MRAKNLALIVLTCLSVGCSSVERNINTDKTEGLTYEEKKLLEKDREEKSTQQIYASPEELYLYHPEKEVYSRSEAIREAVKNILPFLAPVVDFVDKYTQYKFKDGKIGFDSHGGLGIYLEARF